MMLPFLNKKSLRDANAIFREHRAGTAARNRDIYHAYMDGDTIYEIGKVWGLTPQRVHQIVLRYRELHGDDTPNEPVIRGVKGKT